MYRTVIAILIIILIVTSLAKASESTIDYDSKDKAIKVNQIWIPLEQTALDSIASNRDSKAPYPFKIGQIWIP